MKFNEDKQIIPKKTKKRKNNKQDLNHFDTFHTHGNCLTGMNNVPTSRFDPDNSGFNSHDVTNILGPTTQTNLIPKLEPTQTYHQRSNHQSILPNIPNDENDIIDASLEFENLSEDNNNNITNLISQSNAHNFSIRTNHNSKGSSSFHLSSSDQNGENGLLISPSILNEVHNQPTHSQLLNGENGSTTTQLQNVSVPMNNLPANTQVIQVHIDENGNQVITPVSLSQAELNNLQLQQQQQQQQQNQQNGQVQPNFQVTNPQMPNPQIPQNQRPAQIPNHAPNPNQNINVNIPSNLLNQNGAIEKIQSEIASGNFNNNEVLTMNADGTLVRATAQQIEEYNNLHRNSPIHSVSMNLNSQPQHNSRQSQLQHHQPAKIEQTNWQQDNGPNNQIVMVNDNGEILLQNGNQSGNYRNPNGHKIDPLRWFFGVRN